MHLHAVLGLTAAFASGVLAGTPRCGQNYYWDGRKCSWNKHKFCDLATKIISAAHQQSSAAAFCSSYLSVPLSTTSTTTTTTFTDTATATETSGTTTTTDVTVTEGATVTQTDSTTTTFTESPVTTVTQTDTSTSIVTTCPSPTAPPTKHKRGHPYPQPKPKPKPKPKPTCLTTYNPGATLSSACSCLSIVPSTTTLSFTSSETSTTTTTTTVPTTEHATSTTTTTDTMTTTTTFSETETTTQTSTQTQTSTTYIPAIPTFSVLVYGGDRNGNYIHLDGNSPVRLVDNVAGAGQQFSIDASGHLTVVGGQYSGNDVVQAGALVPTDPYLMYVDNTGGLSPTDSRVTPVTCHITTGAADGTCPLACSSASSNGGTQSWDCTVYWRLGVTTPSGCYSWTPYIVGPTT